MAEPNYYSYPYTYGGAAPVGINPAAPGYQTGGAPRPSTSGYNAISDYADYASKAYDIGKSLFSATGPTAAALWAAPVAAVIGGIYSAETDEPEWAGATIGVEAGGPLSFGEATAGGTLANRKPLLDYSYGQYRNDLAGRLGPGYTAPGWIPEDFNLDFSMARTKDPRAIDVGFGAGLFPWEIYEGRDPIGASGATYDFLGLDPSQFDDLTQSYSNTYGDTTYDTTYDLAAALGDPSGQISVGGIGSLSYGDYLAGQEYESQTGREAPLWWLAREAGYADTGH